MVETTNGRPGWRDVLHAVEKSEERVLAKVEEHSQKIDAIDARTKYLERDRVIRAAREGTVLSIIGGLRALVAGIVGAVAALVGMGFLGF